MGGNRAVPSVVSIGFRGAVELEFDDGCWEEPLPRVPVDLLLALPRPKVTTNRKLVYSRSVAPASLPTVGSEALRW